MTLTQQITLDIYDPPYFEYVNAKQADNVSRILIVTLTAHGETLKPSADTETAVFRALKPDRTGVIDPATIGQDGKITVALTDQVLACPGRVEADVSVLRGDEVLSSATFYIQVDKAPVSGMEIESSDEFLVMVQAARDAEEAAGKANTATDRANDAAKLLEGMTVSASKVAAGGTPTAKLTKNADHYDLALGLVTGDNGGKGDKGDKGDKGEQGIQGPVGPAGGVDSVNGTQGDVVIGGVNLALDTEREQISVTKNVSVMGQYWILSDRGKDVFNTIGVPCTISLDAKADVDGQKIGLNLRPDDPASGSFNSLTVTLTTEYKRYSVTRNIAQPGSARVWVLNHPAEIIGNVYVKNLKVELGNAATDWSPAPEDSVCSLNGATGDIEIDPENIVLGTKSSICVLASNNTTTYIDDDGFSVTKFVGNGSAFMTCFMQTIYSGTCLTNDAESGFTMDTDFVPGTYIVSMEARTNNSYHGNSTLNANFQTRLFLRRNGTWLNVGYTGGREVLSSPVVEADENWHALSYKVDLRSLSYHTYQEGISHPPDPGEKIYICVGFITGATATQNDYFEFKKLKIQRGDVATPWQPAFDDYLGPANIWNIPNMHRNIFRGKKLGSALTDAQKAAIAAGTFDDLYIGDYWTINGHTWRIVDIDYWYGQGNPVCNTHHVVVMPDSQLYSGQMHKTESGAYEDGAANTTEGGYALSDMRKTGLDQAKTIATTDFGTNVLNHRIVISNAVKDGHASGYIWDDSTVELCTEWQMYGAPVYNAMNDGVTVPVLYTIDQKQFALMQAVPWFVNPARQNFWLRDVISATYFARVNATGHAGNGGASNAHGVRPAFGVTGV